MRLIASLTLVCAFGLSACGGDGGLGTAGRLLGSMDTGQGPPLFFKAASPAAEDAFGEGLALSADGRFLAVGVDGEDGVNTGVDSPLAIEDRADVGAVYVFRRGDHGWERDAYLKPAVAVRGARFGHRLALAAHGDAYTLLVGAPGDPGAGTGVGADPAQGPTMAGSGAAHVFERDGTGVWRQTAYIKAPFAIAGLMFGSAVSLSLDGQWAAVGMPASLDAGAVALYQRGLNGWGWVGNLGGRSIGGDGDDFGRALQLDARGEHLLVGAPGEDKWRAEGSPVDDGTNDAGGAYVFQRDGNAWSEVAHLNATDATQVGWFGQAVALSSDASTLVIGDPQTPGPFSGGAAYVFDRGPNGQWTQSEFLKPSVVDVAFQFGSAVALSRNGEWAAVGQPYSDDGGSVFVFQHASGTWTLRGQIRDNSIQDEDDFGLALAFDPEGRTLAVGAPRAGRSPTWAGCDSNPLPIGRVFVFGLVGGDVWQPLVSIQSPQPSCFFGMGVALSSGGQVLVVGESGLPTADTPTLGKVHLFQRQGDNWAHTQAIASPLANANGWFGNRVAVSDKGDTLAIADAYQSSSGVGLTANPVVDGQVNFTGTVYLYRRDGAGAWAASPVPVKAPNSQTEWYFGWSLAMSASGDLLVVYGSDSSASPGIGGSQADTSAHWAGAVYLY